MEAGLVDENNPSSFAPGFLPNLDEAVKTVRMIAAPLRPRPGAVAEGAVVKDTLEGVR